MTFFNRKFISAAQRSRVQVLDYHCFVFQRIISSVSFVPCNSSPISFHNLLGIHYLIFFDSLLATYLLPYLWNLSTTKFQFFSGNVPADIYSRSFIDMSSIFFPSFPSESSTDCFTTTIFFHTLLFIIIEQKFVSMCSYSQPVRDISTPRIYSYRSFPNSSYQ